MTGALAGGAVGLGAGMLLGSAMTSHHYHNDQMIAQDAYQDGYQVCVQRCVYQPCMLFMMCACTQKHPLDSQDGYADGGDYGGGDFGGGDFGGGE